MGGGVLVGSDDLHGLEPVVIGHDRVEAQCTGARDLRPRNEEVTPLGAGRNLQVLVAERDRRER